MTEKRKEKIRESAEEIVDSFAEIAEDLPTQEETYYQQDTLNVLRSDGGPTSGKKLEDFRDKFLRVMPDSDEEGNLKVEVAKWTE
ncbi:hypothetical protein AKJ65_00900 [candidate division MSBL1 archaeon SCGC-AAA259E19]|uniref:Uncharacterized protein n=1 Tax=candidate division MSBL1 archaeon SCGC-AAA259E19 TaxID=1698264 RepID=A0A133UNI0_9EURY|nr:hypothetical protein AKJ65_00900 [candidate division MSBL1 archaeon SCGC-AAA259E19]